MTRDRFVFSMKVEERLIFRGWQKAMLFRQMIGGFKKGIINKKAEFLQDGIYTSDTVVTLIISDNLR